MNKIATARNNGAPNRRDRQHNKKKQAAGRQQTEMAFIAKLDPSVHYHPTMVAELKRMGITLEVTVPKKPNKVPITIRLDPDVLEALKEGGSRHPKGWQPWTNDMLRKWLKL